MILSLVSSSTFVSRDFPQKDCGYDFHLTFRSCFFSKLQRFRFFLILCHWSLASPSRLVSLLTVTGYYGFCDCSLPSNRFVLVSKIYLFAVFTTLRFYPYLKEKSYCYAFDHFNLFSLSLSLKSVLDLAVFAVFIFES